MVGGIPLCELMTLILGHRRSPGLTRSRLCFSIIRVGVVQEKGFHRTRLLAAPRAAAYWR